MKFIKFLLILCLCSMLSAKSDKFSNIMLPQSSFLNIDILNCDTYCMQNLIDKKLFFSFLSIYNFNYTTKSIEENYLIYGQALNIFPSTTFNQNQTNGTKIAILIPQKTIGRYAVNSVNTAISYMLAQSNEFEITVFNSNDEKQESIINTINKIKESGYSHVIAPVTQEGAQALVNYAINLYVYIPTLHSSVFPYSPTNIIFGGIDYDAQIYELLNYSSGNVTLFSDGSKLSQSINEAVIQDSNIISQGVFENTKSNFRDFFSRNKNINGTTIFYNTPLITTSLLTSQLRAYKNVPFSQLSTQINYSPMLLTLTQNDDRVNMYIANSIDKIDDDLESINNILGQNIKYDWVSYSTSIGIEYLLSKFFQPDVNRLFKEEIFGPQVTYDTFIYKVGASRFIKQDKIIKEQTNDIDFINLQNTSGENSRFYQSYEESVF